MDKATPLSGPLDASPHRNVVRRVETVIGALFRYQGPCGVLARTWARGRKVLWVAIPLGVYLLFTYG